MLTEVEQLKNGPPRDIGGTQRPIQAHSLSFEIAQALDALLGNQMKLGVIELGNVLNALLDRAVDARILLLEIQEMLLLRNGKINAAKELQVHEILRSAPPNNWDDAKGVPHGIIQHILQIFGNRQVRASCALSHQRDGCDIRFILL
jgi:hypothetical protein